MKARRQWWTQDTSRVIRSTFRRSKPAPCPSSSSYRAMDRLNEDILRHIVFYLSPETLDRVNAVNFVFFEAWMTSRYESLTFSKNDQVTERLLGHLGYVTGCRFTLPITSDPDDHISDPNVANYVKRVLIRPWRIDPPPINQTGLGHSLWTNFNQVLYSDYLSREARRQLRERLQHDVDLVDRAFNAMRNIKGYTIDWDGSDGYHPELYNAFFIPKLRKWAGHLVNLTIKVPSPFLKSLPFVRLTKLETLEYHFCTGTMSARDVDDIHNGFLVFVNNLRDSLACISFISTSTSVHLDMTRIYNSLGLFPKLRSISLSVPFDGGHLSNPLAFVEFLQKHRSMLNNISLLTSRSTYHSTPSHPDCINWIQKILTSVKRPFPQLRSLALAIRPLRAPLTNVSNFLEMHMSTLDSLTLADRRFDLPEFELLMNTARGRLDLTGLRHLRVKLNNFCPTTLYYLATETPGLINLDIECSSIKSHLSDPTRCTDFESFCKELVDKKSLFVNWKLRRMAMVPQEWGHHVESALVECMPNLVMAPSWYIRK